MALSFVQRADANNTLNTVTCPFASNNTAGNLLIVTVVTGNIPSTVTSITGNGNTYNSRMSANDGTSLSLFYYDVTGCAGGANSVSVTVDNSGGFEEVAVWEFATTSGTWNFDQGSAWHDTADPAVTYTVTGSFAEEIMVAYFALFGVAGSFNAGWTGFKTKAGNATSYRITSAIAPYQATVGQGGVNRFFSGICTWYSPPASLASFSDNPRIYLP